MALAGLHARSIHWNNGGVFLCIDGSQLSYSEGLSLGIVKEERIGDCTLYNADCMDILPSVKADLLLTDPPYGINYGGMLKGKGDGSGGADKNGWKGHSAPEWDQLRPAKENFDAMLGASRDQIIWGGNYFTDILPPTMRWLVWDKMQRGFSSADCEFAWSNQKKASRVFSFGRGGESGFAPKSKEERAFINAHPTQKPVALMKWCLGFLPDAQTILDPYLGSASTLVACAKLGRKGIGIELDPEYFDIACKRVEEAYRQPDLFFAPPEPIKQEAMDL